ncbi:MAG TPA: arginine--tRNA ligase [Armatimonadota bacterium]|nr:arginine--tRNA ligase [Armatimonadota bacterium]
MIRELLTSAFVKAATMARDARRLSYTDLPAFTLERPSNIVFGDFSCNLGMLLASETQQPPRQVAQTLMDFLQLPPTLLERLEITGPGFINLFLSHQWLHDVVRDIHAQGDGYGAGTAGNGTSVLVEYVSANPNAPLGIAHGRGAVIGDVLCNVLRTAGYAVTREFYVNDAATSTQMVRFGESLVVRYLQVCGKDLAFPEDGYHGSYVTEIARRIYDTDGAAYVKMPPAERLERFTEMGLTAMLDWQRRVLADLGVVFDHWFRENDLYTSRAVEDVVRELAAHGETYEADGAIWLASTRYGDEKDRPLVRSNGKPTYLASDVAYHREKFTRGFQMLIDIWGPEHHGYIARTKAAMAALGYDPERLHILIFQPVHAQRGSAFLSGAMPEHEAMPLSDLLDEAGRDAARFLLLRASADTELRLDLDLATRQDADNPAYFVQHAYARIAGILRTAGEQGIALPDPAATDLSPMTDEVEISLMRRLTDLPEEILTAAELFEPHRIARYAQELAREFRLFYDRCPVLIADTPAPLRDARLVLTGAVKIALHNVLTLLGVSAPERMEKATV